MHPQGDHSNTPRGARCQHYGYEKYCAATHHKLPNDITDKPCANAGARNIRDTYLSRLVSLLLLALCADGAKTAPGKLEACAGKKIYIMDIGVFAKETGVPLCNLATVRVLLLVLSAADNCRLGICVAPAFQMPTNGGKTRDAARAWQKNAAAVVRRRWSLRCIPTLGKPPSLSLASQREDPTALMPSQAGRVSNLLQP